MNNDSKSAIRNGLIYCATIVGFGAALSAGAQPVLITAPQPPASSGGEGSPDTASDSGEGGLGLASDPTAGTPFHWRKLSFRPSASYNFLYGNGILSSTNRSEKTIVQTITAGLAVSLGEHWSFNYSPSYVMYSNSEFEDTLNHSLGLSWRSRYEDWNFGASVATSISSDPQTETAQQTDQEIYSASVTVGRQLNGSLSWDSATSINFRLADKFNSSRTYDTMHWLNYQYGPNLGLGLGAGGGYEEATQGADMVFERVLGRLVWHIINKLDLSLNGGPEFRQFRSDQASIVTPTYGAALTYRPFDTTTLTLSGNRSVGSSYFANQYTETTSVSLSLSQRFLRRYFIGLSGGVTFTDYGATEKNLASDTGRGDSSTFFSASIGTSFRKRGAISAFYSHSENDSNESAFSYNSDQVGFTISYSY